MNIEDYQKIVKKKSKCNKTLENAFISFLVGGVIGAIGEILVKIYMNTLNLNLEMSLALKSLSFILLAVILTGAGVFDNLITKFKFGLILPITGFAHSIASALIDNRKDGFVTGMGANAFKLAGSVILYGIVATFAFTILKVIIYG